MKTAIVARLAPLASVLLFVLAAFLLRHELRGHTLHEIFVDLAKLSDLQVIEAIGLTVVGYVALTGYDALAVWHLGYPLKYRQVALGAFAGYAFSNTVGLSVLASIPVRCHVYSAYGLSALQVSEIVLFCALTFWLGFLTLAGVVFVIAAPLLPHESFIPFVTARPIGVIFLILVGAYLVWSFLNKAPIRIRDAEIRLPSFPIALAQIGISCLDWTLAACVLYLLFPAAEHLSFGTFFGAFLLAQVAGLISHVPGGLGVFESVMLTMLTPAVRVPSLFGALILFRIIYYLFPLVTAGLLLAGRELYRKRTAGARIRAAVAGYGQVVVPQVLSITTFVAGTILLLSGALPAEQHRLKLLRLLLIPLPVMEISHFLGSLIGVGLIFLARGIQRRLDAAYWLTMLLLGLGSLFSLLKGFDFEEAIALGLMLLALLPCHRYFYRKSALISQHLTPSWTAALLIVVAASLWLGTFAYKHVDFSEDLWWKFAFHADAPRFWRASVGVLILIVLGGGLMLFEPAPRKGTPPTSEELDKIVPIVQAAADTSANLALLGDKSILFSDDERGFVMYAIEGRTWIALRDPIGPAEQIPELVWKFQELCEGAGRPVFYQVGTTYLPVYIDAGFNMLKLGEEGRVPLPEFALEGGERKGLRKTYNRLQKEGCSFEIVPVEQTAALMPELSTISESWLKEKHTREKGFSLGSFRPDYIRRFPTALVRKEGRVVAFANVWMGGGQEELSIDLMRHFPEAPDGTMEYLFIELMLWGRQAGYQWFNLGMAPLSGLESRRQSPLWNRMGDIIYRHGEQFYRFQGLRHYKEKFDPVWEPKYLAAPGGIALPLILTNITTLIAGGLKGVVSR